MNFTQIKETIDLSREYDRAINSAWDNAQHSSDIDLMHRNISQIVKECASGDITEFQAVQLLRKY